jgi:hypothetical protein
MAAGKSRRDVFGSPLNEAFKRLNEGRHIAAQKSRP